MKGLRFRHPMANQFPPAITESRARDIIDDVCHGDKAAMDELIVGHIQYACSIVSKYLLSLNSPSASDDLTEAAFYGLVDGVNAIARNGLSHDNVTGYLAKRINGEIRNFLAGRSIIQTPRGDDPLSIVSIRSAPWNHGHHSNRTNEPSVESDTTIEVEEDILCLIADSTDECIIRMLQRGDTAADIARHLGLHRGSVGRRINRIQQSYKELQE